MQKTMMKKCHHRGVYKDEEGFNIDGIVIRGSALYDKVRFVLQQALREPRNYFPVLQAIAFGNTRQNEIKQAAAIDNIAPYLETLQQLHLVERIIPVTESQSHKRRRDVYRLKDNFLRFWFRFALPNYSQLERGAKKVVFDTVIAPDLDAFTFPVFLKTRFGLGIELKTLLNG